MTQHTHTSKSQSLKASDDACQMPLPIPSHLYSNTALRYHLTVDSFPFWRFNERLTVKEYQQKLDSSDIKNKGGGNTAFLRMYQW